MIPSALPVISATLASSQPVWNLLHYDTEEQGKTDFATRPQVLAGTRLVPVTVFQFGAQSPDYWVMVECDLTDPTSFSPHLALQYFPGQRYLNFVNSTYIQDLQGLQVSGYFSNGLP